MKNKLLPLFVVLGSFSAYSQVGVGTLDPNSSAQLEVVAKDKGILIPRVELKSITDKERVVLPAGKTSYENSLLVFNIGTDITPGYYYWYIDRWHRLAVSDEVVNGKDGINGGTGAPGAR